MPEMRGEHCLLWRRPNFRRTKHAAEDRGCGDPGDAGRFTLSHTSTGEGYGGGDAQGKSRQRGGRRRWVLNSRTQELRGLECSRGFGVLRGIPVSSEGPEESQEGLLVGVDTIL